MTDLVESVRRWVADWGDEVAAVDFAAGRRRFHPDALAFGTRADVVVGVDVIEEQQWRQVWPNIDDFEFAVDALEVQVGDDESLVVALVPWTSTGYDEHGVGFERPGRATIVLRPNRPRRREAPEWLAIHTHFSLTPGTPPRTFGRTGNLA